MIMKPKPSVGRIVHYLIHSEGAIEPRAAIITKVNDEGDSVHLQVFNYNHMYPRLFVVEGTGAGEWSWPERV
jgi:hypothetical protein